MKQRFDDEYVEQVYQNCRQDGFDLSSDFYWGGKPHLQSDNPRVRAYWAGYQARHGAAGMNPNPRRTDLYAAWAAGQDNGKLGNNVTQPGSYGTPLGKLHETITNAIFYAEHPNYQQERDEQFARHCQAMASTAHEALVAMMVTTIKRAAAADPHAATLHDRAIARFRDWLLARQKSNADNPASAVAAMNDKLPGAGMEAWLAWALFDETERSQAIERLWREACDDPEVQAVQREPIGNTVHLGPKAATAVAEIKREFFK